MMSESNKLLGLFFAAGILAIILVFQLVTQTGAFIDRLEAKANKKEVVLQEVAVLAAQLKSAKNLSQEKSGRVSIPSLLPWLEKETLRAHFAGHVREIAPVTLQGSDSGLFREKAALSVVEISMESALRFLHQLESVATIRIVRGDLKRSEKELGGVTLSVEIALL